MLVPAPIPVGSVLNNTYRLERLIARGGMGAVYEAAHLRLTRRFAVKVLAGPLGHHLELMDRFRREAEIIGSIGHPHIVDAVDFNQTEDGKPYIVMELLEGETLGARLRREGPLPITAAAHIFMQTASALEAAHLKGIVHRDLKPPNIFLCKRGRQEDFVKIFDFGISKVVHALTELTRAGVVMGTVTYMSPEQVQGDRDLDRRSDVYAMGSILHEMLSGSTPFSGDATIDIFRNVMHTPPPPLRKLRPTIPAAVERVVLRALAKTPADRFDSMLEFWDALAGALRESRLDVPESTEERQSLWPLPDQPAPAVQRREVPAGSELESPATQETTTGHRDAPRRAPAGGLDMVATMPARGRLRPASHQPAALDAQGPAQPSEVLLNTGDILETHAGLTQPSAVSLHTRDVVEVRPLRRPRALYIAAAVAVIGTSAGIIAGLAWSQREPRAARLPSSYGGALSADRSGARPLLQADAAVPDLRAAPADAALLPETAPLPADLAAAPASRPSSTRVKLRVAPKRVVAGSGQLAIQAMSGGRTVLPQIFVDGQAAGQPPLLLRLKAGVHTVEARLAGYATVSQQARVVAGAERRLVLYLVPR